MKLVICTLLLLFGDGTVVVVINKYDDDNIYCINFYIALSLLQ